MTSDNAPVIGLDDINADLLNAAQVTAEELRRQAQQARDARAPVETSQRNDSVLSNVMVLDGQTRPNSADFVDDLADGSTAGQSIAATDFARTPAGGLVAPPEAGPTPPLSLALASDQAAATNPSVNIAAAVLPGALVDIAPPPQTAAPSESAPTAAPLVVIADAAPPPASPEIFPAGPTPPPTDGPINAAPTDITLDGVSINENTSAGTIIGSLSGFDPDAGDTLTLALTGGRTDLVEIVDGNLVLREGASLDFETAQTFSIDVTATDSNGLSVTRTFIINVGNENEGPVAAIALADQSASEDAAFSFTVPAGSFTDVDAGDTMALSATLANGDPLPAWLSFDPATGTFSGTPANGDVGTIELKVTATDAAGASVAQTFDLAVANTNDGPVAAIALADQGANEDAAFSFTVPAGSFTDVDVGDTMALSATLANGDPLPAWLSFDPATGTFSGTPANGDVGAIELKVTATDAAGSSVAQTFDLAVANTNDGPVAAIALSDQSASEDAAFSFTVPAGSFTDVDAGDTMALSATLANGDPLPAWLSFDAATGTFSGTPTNGDVGTIELKVTATDAAGASVAQTFDLAVANTNDGPVAAIALADQSASEDAAFSFTVPAGSFTDVDAGDTMSLSATLANGDPLPAWLSFDATTGTFSGTPANGDVGAIELKVTATDAAGASVAQTFDLAVANTNDGPVAAIALADQSASEDAAFTFTVPAGSFTDVDAGDTMSLSATLANGDPLPAWLSFDPATGTFSGTPANGDVGTIELKVTATDAAGASVAQTFDLAVANTNDGPVAAIALSDQSASEDAAFSFTVPAGSFTDVDAGDTMALSATLANGDPLPAWLSFDASTGTFSGTPANGDVGTIELKVTATDAAGASVAQTFDLAVANTNDGPVAAIALSDQSASEDAAFSFTVPAGSFTDVDAGDTMALSATLANGDPLPAWLSFDPATGTFSGTPANGDVGAIELKVTATDAAGASVAQTFDLAVANTNDGPVAAIALSDQSASEDAAFSFTVPAGSFTDVDAGDTMSLSATLANGDPLPAWLSFDPATGTFSGTPANGDVGTIELKVTATDAAGASVAQTFDLAVANTNDAAVITSASTATVAENTVGTVYTATATDVDAGSTITYSLTGADAALFTIDASTGAVSFKSAANFEAPKDSGSDNVYDITVNASDGTAVTTQDVAISVSDVNEAASFTSATTASMAENATGTVYTAAATDPDAGAKLSYSISGSDAALFNIDAATGAVSFKSAPDYEKPADAGGNNVYDVKVSVSDGTNVTTQDVAVSVTNVNEAASFTSATTASVAENSGGTVYTAVATDPDAGATLSYSIAGSDAALFTIDATTGAVSFKATPDFEAPQDAGGDNVYDLKVSVSDGKAITTQDVAVSVTNVNEGPVITSATATETPENATDVIYKATASDPDAGATLTYSISGADAALFTIDAKTGEIAFKAAPDYETPLDGAPSGIEAAVGQMTGLMDQAYRVLVEVLGPDAVASPLAVVQGFETRVLDLVLSGGKPDEVASLVAEAEKAIVGDSKIDLSAAVESIFGGFTATTVEGLQHFAATDEGAAALKLVVEYDAKGLEVASSGASPEEVSAIFADINKATAYAVDGALSTLPTDKVAESIDPSTVGDNTYDIVLSVSDGTNVTTQDVAISVTNVNEAASFTSATTASVAENTTGTVYTAAATDPDAGAKLSYSLSGADAKLFSIDATTGAVSFTSAPNFEKPTDNGGDNVYDVKVSVTDGTNVTTQDVAISVTNVNEAASFTSATTATFAENATGTVYTATATDPDAGAKLSYSISGADASLFSIDATTGAVSFKAAPDYEKPADAGGNNVYDVKVSVSDGANVTTQDVAITVTNVNEAASFTSATTASVAENTTGTVYTAAATDPDAGAKLSYSISGADASLFSIDATTGAVSFKAAPDYEKPADAGGNNVYDVKVSVSDGANVTTQDVAITVTNVNEAASFTSATTASVAENTTGTVYTAAATDPDAGAKLSYSLSGADAKLFSIDATTGAVSFTSAPNFEKPTDNGGDNVYDVKVSVTDGTNVTTQDVAISVTNVNEAASFTSATTASVAENTTGTVYTAAATDPDAGAKLSYSLSGADAKLFSIDATTGAVSFTSAPNFEKPTDNGGDNVYDVKVSVTDGTNVTTQDVAISVTNVNEAASFTSATTASIAENATGTVYTATATDPDAGAKLSYSISGADASIFSIDATTGAVSFKAAPDYEKPADAGGNNVYDVKVSVSDGANVTTQDVAITVTNVNEAASFTSATTASVAENTTGTVYTAAATDPDAGAKLSYSLSGADAKLFSIDATTGAVSFTSAPNFEKPTDNGGDNVYDVKVSVSDGTNVTTQDVAISVTNVNEAASFTSATTATFAENTTGAVYTAAATDPDAGAKLSYSLSGSDVSLFNIDATTGAVAFKSAPDFEKPTDAGGNNVYDVKVSVTDGANVTTQDVSISVTNVNETPTLTSDSSATVVENIATTAYTIVAVDPDAGATVFYSLSGADSGLFSIDTSTGEVTFLAPPSYDNPDDADGNNIYDVVVTASDGSLTTSQAVTINVDPSGAQNVTPVDSPVVLPVTSGLDDTFTFDTGAFTAGLVVDGGAGRDTIVLTGNNDLSAGTVKSFEALTLQGQTSATLNGSQIGVGFDALTQVTGGAGSQTLVVNVDKNGSTDLSQLTFSNWTAGEDTIVVNGSTGNETISGSSQNDVMSGGAGVDTLSYAGATAAVTVSLALTTAQITGGAGTDTVSQFENLTGTKFADRLTGDAGDNVLAGGAGADTISGGGGNDTADYSTSSAGVTVNLTLATAQVSTGDASGDVLSGIENITGSNYNDTLTGDANANLLSGGAGDDMFVGGAGADTIIGGSGSDTISYAASTAAVTVDLTVTGAQTSTGDAAGDVLSGVENITGTSLADKLTGDANANTFAGGAGADTLNGGAGSDTLDYRTSASGVSVNLATNSASGGDAAGDVISNFENLLGSSTAADTLTGDANANLLSGFGGNDSIDGGDGNDTIIGGTGADSMIGGLGDDVFMFAASDVSSGEIISGGSGTDTLIFSGTNSLTSSTVSSIEAVAFTAAATLTVNASQFGSGLSSSLAVTGGAGTQNVTVSVASNATLDLRGVTFAGWTAGVDRFTINGVSGNETIYGTSESDNISAKAGNDLVFAGAGNDTVVGGSGNDTLDGGAGIDTLSYAGSWQGVTVNLATGAASGGDAKGDVFSGFENILGSSRADSLTGDSGNNLLDGGSNNDTLDGGAGDDTLIGGSGADVLIGGSGIDTASYAASTAAVTVNLSTGVGTGGYAGGDKLSGIENVIGSAFADTLSGDTNDNVITGGAGADTLSGGGGNDTADYSTSTSAIAVSLATGLGTAGDAKGDVLSGFENLRGSAYSDTLSGDANANLLSGGAGNDTLIGGAGADTLAGGDGADTADYTSSATAVTVDLRLTTAQTSTGDASGDVLSGIESVTGTAYADKLTGDANANVLTGGAGDDTLIGGLGADYLIGGSGIDTADYSASSAAINVNLTTTLGIGGDAEGDVLIEIENVIGSSYADVMIGDSGADALTGGAGDDTLAGGLGADTLIGGAGLDTVDYSTSSSGVAVDLSTGLGSGGDATGDTISGVENIVGSAYADKLTGDSSANVLTGGAGDDNLIGGGGADNLIGGSGLDTVDYSASSSAVSVDLSTGLGSGGDAAGDTISGVENIVGSGYADTLTGDANANLLSGGAGDDRLAGGLGADTLTGGAGTDTADYSASDAGITVNMATGINLGGHAAGDVLVGIENITGSGFSDMLTGDARDNLLVGGAGNDTFFGGLGNDTMTGDAGSDLFIMQAGHGNDAVTGGAGGGWTDVIELHGAGGADYSGATMPSDWTLVLTHGSVVSTANETMTLTDDSAGYIQHTDGTTVTFSEVEQIRW